MAHAVPGSCGWRLPRGVQYFVENENVAVILVGSTDTISDELRPYGHVGYAFDAPTRYDRLFSGLATPRPEFVPEGTTRWASLTPEETLDADYGLVLERAHAALGSLTDTHVKVVASPTGFGDLYRVPILGEARKRAA